MVQVTPHDFASHRAAVRRRLDEAVAEGRAGRSGPESVTWRINREIVVVAGWGRAILMQLAHPLVAAGVARHSTFRGNPFAGFQRLFATIGAMQSLTFGDDEEAIAAAAGVNLIHDRVFGELEEPGGGLAPGTPYSAHQPDLLAWVHATLIDSLPRTYELLVSPLAAADRDRYCRETTGMEALLGLPPGTLPTSQRELDDYLERMLTRGPIEVGETARRLARDVLHPPMSSLLWPAFRPIRLITIGLLPAGLRRGYGYSWSHADARALARWARAIRWLRARAPHRLREWPAAFGRQRHRPSALR